MASRYPLCSAAITSEGTSDLLRLAKAEVTRGIAFQLSGVNPWCQAFTASVYSKRSSDLKVRFSQFATYGAIECRTLAAVAMMLVMQTGHPVLSTLFPHRKRRVSAIAVVLLPVCWLAAQSQKPVARPTKSSLAGAIDRTLDQGHDAILPPHVSNLLGISPQEREVPVKQFVQMGEPIRGFDVSAAEHNNVVLFVESRAQKQTTYYLASRRGTLRKVLAVIDGVGNPRVPTKDDRDIFEQEKQHWIDSLAPKHS